MKLPLPSRAAVLLAALLSISLVALPARSSDGPDWNTATRLVKQSTVRLEFPIDVTDSAGTVQHFHGVCTGFVINEENEYVMSANHCWGPGLTVDGKTADPIWFNETEDVMVLHVEGIGKHALVPYGGVIEIGEPIAALGYARGSKFVSLRVGHVSAVDAVFPELPGTWLVIGTPYIGGMSGGPVFTPEGQLIGIVQRTSDVEGIGRNVFDVLDLTRKYWNPAQHGLVWHFFHLK